jgi:hypothetical protein
MMDANQLAARATVLAQFRANLEALQDDLACFDGVTLGQGFIVVGTAGQAITFDISNTGKVTNPRQTIAKLAVRFERQDAEHVAANVKDGNGQPARAVHVRQAILDQIESTKKVILQLEAL